MTLSSSVSGALTPTDTCSGGSYDITTAALSENTHIITATQQDVAGNTSSASSALSVTVDTTDPNVDSTSSTTLNGTYKIGDDINITVTISEAVVDNGTTVNVGLDTGVSITTSYLTSTTFSGTYTVGDGENTSDLDGNLVSLGGTTLLEDLAGNSTSGVSLPFGASIANSSDIVIDGVAPTVTVEQVGGQADPTTISPINFTVTFSEAVSGFATGDVSLSGTAGATTGTVSEIAPNDGTTYSVAVSGMTKDGTVTAQVEAGKAVDAAGNGNAASTSTDDTVTYYLHPTIDKAFSPDTIGAGDVSTMTFTLTNPNGSTTLNDLNYTDTFPAGLQIAATPNIGGTCNSNNVLATHFTPNLAAAGTQVNLVSGSAYSLAPKASCTITVDVTTIITGAKVNTTGVISSTETGTGSDDATDTLTVNDPTLTINMLGNFNTDAVTSTPGTIDCPGTCDNSFTYNTNVTLDVTVDPGSSFQGWSDDCAAFGSALSGSISINSSKDCTASFVVQPEIDVQRPAANSTADGGTDIIGNQAPGTVNLTYTVDNSAGGAQLTISAVTVDNLVNASNFNLVTGMPLDIAAGGTGSFDISFDVDALGAFSLDMHIANNDPDEDPYDIQIAGTGAAVPEIDVLGNDVSIFDGDPTPETANHTDFGNADENGATITRTFIIKNTGLADLNLSGGPPAIAIGGTHAADFALTMDATTPVSAGGQTTFTITFDPSAQGLRQATVSIDNNDGDENPFDFSIQGTGTGPAPEMDVLGNGVSIPAGDTSPSALDQTDFGFVEVVDAQVTYTYTIQNTGSVDLNLTDNPKVTLSGTRAADFTLTADAASPVTSAGGTTTFEITFDPRGGEVSQATVSIANDDNDENPNTFEIRGQGLVKERGNNPATQKFNMGEDGGEFTAYPVIVIVPPGAVPNGTELTIQRVPLNDGDGNIIIGDQVFDIAFTGPDGEEITDFSLPIQIMFRPNTAQLRAASFDLDNLHVLTRHGDKAWRDVPNAYNVDGWRCVDMWQFSEFGLGVAPLPETGFAQGPIHVLPEQSVEKRYFELDVTERSVFCDEAVSSIGEGDCFADARNDGNFVLEITSLGLELPIVGVPLTEHGWDVTWLGDRAGYLEGTAFPTWVGNTAITAHVWDAHNQPGSFIDLHTLKHGDQLEINAFGKRYIYEVRQNTLVDPYDLEALAHTDYDVLTLVTCEGFNSWGAEYQHRRIVQAVLIKVE